MKRSVESYVAGIAGAAAILIAVFDLVGLLESERWKWLAEHIPVFTLLCIGMALALLFFFERDMEEIRDEFKKEKIERLSDARSLLNPNLDLVIGAHISGVIDGLTRALQGQTYTLNDLELFRSFYRRTLTAFKGASFYATSIPSQAFFWRHQATEAAMATFIKNGGTMTRIFFLESPDQLHSDEVRIILNKQVDMNVQVYVLPMNEVPDPLKKFFMVDSDSRIGWEPNRAPNNVITGITLTSDRDTLDGYKQSFRDLLELSGTKLYQPSDEAFDMNSRPSVDKPSIDALAFHKFEHQGWEVSTQAYAQYFGQLTNATTTYLLDEVNAGVGSRLIDLATGPGYVAAVAQKRGCEVVGVDFSESMVSLAKSVQSSAISFVVGDVQKLAQSDGSFDCAVMNFGILHLSEPNKAIAEAFRVLKPGGRFAFTVWARPDEAKGFSLVLRAIETFGIVDVPIPMGPPFFAFSDPVHAERILADNGFLHISSQQLPLVWTLDSPQDVFTAFYEGTARTGGLLRRQTSEALSAIKHAVTRNCAPYVNKGKTRIPMPAFVYSATKPGS